MTFTDKQRERRRRNDEAKNLFERLTPEHHWRLGRGETVHHSNGDRLRYQKMAMGGFGIELSEDNGETWRMIAVQDWRLIPL